MTTTAQKPSARRPLALLVLGALLAALGVGLAATSASADGGRIQLTKGGSPVAESSQVSVKTSLGVRVSGFGAGSTVLFQLGPDALPLQVTTDSEGAGSGTFTVPTLPSDVYLLTATSDSADATFALYVYNPATKVPSNPPVAGGTTTGTTGKGTTGKGSTSKGTTHSSKGSSHASTDKTLAHTGSLPVPAALGALVLVVLGGLLVRAGAIPVLGRHQRVPGAHALLG